MSPPIQLTSFSMSSRRATNNSAGGEYAPALSDETRAAFMNTLVAHNSLQPIRSTLEQHLAAAGWMDSLRANVGALIRSGECSSYEEIMERIMAEIRPGPAGATDADLGDNESVGDETGESEPEKSKKKKGSRQNLANGTRAKSSGAESQSNLESLKVPEPAVAETIKVIRREIEKVCEVVLDN